MKKRMGKPGRIAKLNLQIEQLERRYLCAVGDLDRSFSRNGLRAYEFLGQADVEQAAAVAIQSDGKIVAAGTFTFNGRSESAFAVARFNNDGSLDTSFGNGGKVTIDFGFSANDEKATAVAIQDNGKIVVAGYATIGGDQDFVVARLDANGQLDTSFSQDGRLSFNFAGGDTNNDQAYGVAIQNLSGQRKIVVVGSAAQSGRFTDFAVVRFSDDGTVDGTFNAGGTPGIFVTSFGRVDVGNAVAVDAQNRIVIAGNTDAIDANDFAVLRLLATGEADLAFGPDGKRFTDLGGDDQASAVAIQSNGRIVVAGRGGAGSNFAVARYTDSNGLDTDTFGAGAGFVTYDFGSEDVATGVAIQSNGRIVVGGYTKAGVSMLDRFAAMRLLPNGLLDRTFNDVATPTTSDGDGKAVYQFADNSQAYGLALDSLERIVLVGRTTNATQYDFALARIAGDSLGSVLTLSAGVATFTDLEGIANNLSITRNATNLVFTDTSAKIASNFRAPSTTVSLPLAQVGKLVINTLAGNDRVSITIPPTGFALTLGIQLALGANTDTLIVSGNVDFTMNDVRLVAGDARITFTGLERVILQGGNGINRIDTRAFTGSAVLDGGAGNDTLLAGNGRNILIGGSGKDNLTGGTNGDILIGGRTTLDIRQSSFSALVDKWVSTLSYTARVTQIRAGTGLPSGIRLAVTTVPDDTAVDSLLGGNDFDWFWAYPLDTNDKVGSELLN